MPFGVEGFAEFSVRFVQIVYRQTMHSPAAPRAKRKTPKRFASGLFAYREYFPDTIGADYEARTRYLHLGKVALYQMS